VAETEAIERSDTSEVGALAGFGDCIADPMFEEWGYFPDLRWALQDG
jgi:hypothetical protein